MADAANIPFFINARTDVFFQRPPEQHDTGMLVQVIERANAYREAGADGLFAPGLADITLIARLAKVSPLPAQHHGWRRHSARVRTSRAWRRKGELWSPTLRQGDDGVGRSGAASERVTRTGRQKRDHGAWRTLMLHHLWTAHDVSNCVTGCCDFAASLVDWPE